MDEQIVFSLRVAVSATAFLVYILLLQEAVIRGANRRFDLAFFLALSCSGLSLGMFAALTWHAMYVFSVLQGSTALWMLNSSFVTGYTAIIMLSAVALMHSLTLSMRRTCMCIGLVAGSGLFSYLWIGGVL